ncbi:hypothetical protein ABZ348_12885 [Streptomyces sp. NPDC005963]|uniref:hypothetical protein n=1 Tax=Streptomyces sp. NPDC005963 TaxID=3156721 RepID=UPI0033ED0E89
MRTLVQQVAEDLLGAVREGFGGDEDFVVDFPAFPQAPPPRCEVGQLDTGEYDRSASGG